MAAAAAAVAAAGALSVPASQYCTASAGTSPRLLNPPTLPSTQGALLNAVIIGSVNLLSTLVSIYFVDRAGRRILFLEGGVQMFLAQASTGGGRCAHACTAVLLHACMVWCAWDAWGALLAGEAGRM